MVLTSFSELEAQVKGMTEARIKYIESRLAEYQVIDLDKLSGDRVVFGCTVEVIKSDGAVVNVMDEESNRKVREFASDAVEKVKENIPVSINVDVKHESDAVDAEVEEVPETKDDQ